MPETPELTRAQRFNRALQRYQLASESIKLEVIKSLVNAERRLMRRENAGKMTTPKRFFACYYGLYKASRITLEDLMFLAEYHGKITILQIKREKPTVLMEYIFTTKMPIEKAKKLVLDHEEDIKERARRVKNRANNFYNLRHPEKLREYSRRFREKRKAKRRAERIARGENPDADPRDNLRPFKKQPKIDGVTYRKIERLAYGLLLERGYILPPDYKPESEEQPRDNPSNGGSDNTSDEGGADTANSVHLSEADSSETGPLEEAARELHE